MGTGGLSAFLKMNTPPGENILTTDAIESMMRDLFEEHHRRDDRISEEHMTKLRERGVVLADDRLIFTLESKGRIADALARNDFDALNSYEIVALNILYRQAARSERMETMEYDEPMEAVEKLLGGDDVERPHRIVTTLAIAKELGEEAKGVRVHGSRLCPPNVMYLMDQEMFENFLEDERRWKDDNDG